MKKLLSLSAAALVLATTASWAQPTGKVEILLKSGFWEAFGGVSNAGNPVCGVAETGAAGKMITVKWFYDHPRLYVQLYKSTWEIPDGAQISVRFKFDNDAPWEAHAAKVTANGIQFNIPPDGIKSFVNQMAAASHLYIAFPSGSETIWDGNLDGAYGAMHKMLDCMNYMNAHAGQFESGGGQTEPYGSTTQPFGSAPSEPTPTPSQPYTHTRF